MITIDIQGDTRAITARLQGLTLAMEKTATARALNRAIDATATAANRGIRERYNLKRAAVEKAMKKVYASPGQAVPAAEVSVSGRRISLYEFDARERGGTRGRAREITVLLSRARGREVVRGRKGLAGKPFVAVVSGPRAIWQRVGKARFPVKQVKGPSLPYAFVRRTLQKELRRVAGDVFEKNLQQQVKFLSRGR